MRRPILELGEEVLDLVALTVEAVVLGIRYLRVRLEGIQGSMPFPVVPLGTACCHKPRSAISIAAGGKA